MRLGIVQAVYRLARRGQASRPVYTQTRRGRDQAELDRIPVEPRKVMQVVQTQGAQPALAIGLHVVGEDRVGQHRHMAEHVVEDVRLRKVVESWRSRMKRAAGKRRLARRSKNAASGIRPGTATTRQPVRLSRRGLIAAKSGMPPLLRSSASSPSGRRHRRGGPAARAGARRASPDCVLLLAVTLPILLDRKIRGRIGPVPNHQLLRAHPLFK